MGLSDALVEPTYFDLNGIQLRDDRLAGKARVAWQPLIAAFRHNPNQLMQSFTPLGSHQSELGKVRTKCVDQLSPLTDQEIPRPVQHQHALLLDVLDRHKSHRWPRDGLADRRCIGRVVLAALPIGLDIGRRHEPRVMPQLPELACPLMGRCAGLHANAARRQIGKELKNSRSTNTLADHHRAFSIDAVNLKQILGDIQTDRANLAHGRFPSMWLRFDLTTLWHFDAAEWAPSTTSKCEELKVRIMSPLMSQLQTLKRTLIAPLRAREGRWAISTALTVEAAEQPCLPIGRRISPLARKVCLPPADRTKR